MKVKYNPTLLVALMSGALLSYFPVTARAQISGVSNNIVTSDLDGVGYYTLPTISDLGGDLTVEGWVNVSSYAAWGRIADLGQGQASNNIILGTEGTTGKPIFQIYSGATLVGSVAGPSSLATNTWVHVAGVIQTDRTMRLYLNGTQVATSTASVDAASVNRTSNYLGESNWAPDALLNGGIADVRVWNTARSQAEIQDNLPVGSITGPTNGLVAAYAFGATGDTPTADLSGNGYTATQNGALDYAKSGTGTLTTGGFSNAGATVNLDVTGGQLNITSTNTVDRLRVQSAAVAQAAGSSVTTTAIGDGFQVGVSAGQTGSYAISGGSLDIANSGLAYIGASGNGTMTQTGGEVTTDGWTVVGRYNGGVGDYTISGGSLSHSSAVTRILVGEEGTGTLTISGTGAASTSGGVSIAYAGGGVGTVNLEGGTLTTPGIAKGAGTSATLNMDGGTIVASGNNNNFMSGLNVAELKAGGGTLDDGGFQISVGQVLGGAGGLTKTGSGTMTLTGANTYTGATAINAGTLKLTVANDSSGYAIAAGSVLELSSDSAPVLYLKSGTYTGDGTLRKTGSKDLVWGFDGSEIPSIALGSAATIDVQAGRMQATYAAKQIWTNNQATLNVAAGALFDVDAAAVRVSGLTGSGTIRLGLAGPFPEQKLTVGVANASSEFAGVIQDLNSSAPFEKVGTGTLTLSGTNTYTGSTTVAGGGIVLNGSIASSTTTVKNGGWLGGSGTVGSLIVEGGGTVSPGNSPGTLNINGDIDWLGGGNYNWQIVSAEGTTPGTDWDFQLATGELDLSALTASSQFNINLWSLTSTAPDVSGALLDFDANQSYTWTILTASSGITGYTGTGQFAINTAAINGTAGFANALASGWGFSVLQDGNNLNLVYAQQGPEPIPEPGTWAAAALLVGGAAFARWRKRAKTS